MASERKQPVSPQHLPFLTLVLLLLIAFYALHGPVRSWLSGRYRAVHTFEQALNTILDEYVDPRPPRELVHGGIQGMIEALDDRHSAFLSPTDHRRLERSEQGKYAGLGITIRLYDGKVLIQEVFEGAPAQRAGLRPGDFIVAADGQDFADVKNLGAVSEVLRGQEGTEVTLGILRNGTRLETTVTREVIAKPVVEHKVLEPGIGYIRIHDFPDQVGRHVEEALGQLTEQGVRAVALDVRWNQGGFLDEAVRVADLFIADGDIVSTRSRHRRDDRTWRAEPGGSGEDLVLVVLVNGGSASAAEVVAGALQDHGRARLVGSKTYGKGAVNKRFPLPDGSGILLSTGKYYLPKGRLIEGEGLEPDVAVEPPSRDQLKDIPPGVEPPDPQRDRAVALLRQRLARP